MRMIPNPEEKQICAWGEMYTQTHLQTQINSTSTQYQLSENQMGFKPDYRSAETTVMLVL